MLARVRLLLRAASVAVPREELVLICWLVNVLLPRNTYDLAQSAKPSSCTCTCVPNVMRPTSAFSGSSESACVSDARAAASSSSSWQTSSTNRKAGGGGLGCCIVYSIVV